MTGVESTSDPGPRSAPPVPAHGVELGQPLLEAVDISRHYPGVQALDQVHLRVDTGEVHALLGENGAGKSTLIKIVAGAEHADDGQITFLGQHARFDNTYAARVAGIASVFQEFTLIPDLTVAENVFVHQDSAYRRFWIFDRGGIDRRVMELFERMGIGGLISPRAKVRTLSAVQQQLVEIAKAIALDARLIILDEPTSALSPQEVELTFELVRSLVAQGIGFIFISHRLEEVAQIATTVTVLRDGKNILSRVPACPHGGGAGLDELAQHLCAFDYVAVSGDLTDRLLEYVAHLYEHFVDPVRVTRGRFRLPHQPGFSSALRPEAIAAYSFPEGTAWRS